MVAMMKAQVVRWMQNNSDLFTDPTTNEVNTTELAEAAGDEFNCVDETGYVPEEFYDWAVELFP